MHFTGLSTLVSFAAFYDHISSAWVIDKKLCDSVSRTIRKSHIAAERAESPKSARSDRVRSLMAVGTCGISSNGEKMEDI
jgi:hypothetical protein